jgi:hypothetical protein
LRLRDLNSFILTGIALLVVGIAGIVKGNRWLSEPGMPLNPYAWQVYLAAAALMFINGAASIIQSRREEEERRAASAQNAPNGSADATKDCSVVGLTPARGGAPTATTENTKRRSD